MRRNGLYALPQKSGPIVWLHRVQCRNDIVKSVRLERGRAAWTALERTAEIIQRFLVLAKLADQYVGIEPDQRTFVVIVDAPPVFRVILARVIEQLRGDRCVL